MTLKKIYYVDLNTNREKELNFIIDERQFYKQEFFLISVNNWGIERLQFIHSFKKVYNVSFSPSIMIHGTESINIFQTNEILESN